MKRVADRKAQTPLAKLERLTNAHSQSVSNRFVNGLQAADGPRIIAEVKGRSPTKGQINANFNVVEVAKAYQEAGAAAVSVLTEPEYFGGHIENLRQIRLAAPDLPLLQKDFILEEYQIVEASVFGADAILLIAAMLGEGRLRQLHDFARTLGLAVLVETHTAAEVEYALAAGVEVIGVNNRDLHTMQISLDVSRSLSRYIAKAAATSLFISESGISKAEEIKELSGLGYRGFLIGSSLMQTLDPGLALRGLINSVQS